MNVAILFLSLALTGADVGPPTGDNSDLGLAPPTSQVPVQPELRSALQRQGQSNRTRGVPAGSVRGSTRAAPQSSTMPSAPTSESDSDQTYNFGAPTAAPSAGGGGLGTGMGSGGTGRNFYGSRRPTSPTRPGPGQARSYNAQQDAQLLQMKIQAAQQASAPAARQSVSKAFSNYQASSGNSSAWMGLYRTGTNNGTVDNYTTLVRPQFDQRRTNQQLGSEIEGLQNLSRVQGFSLQQLNRDTQNLQGVKYQQFYNNYGDFYPSARQ
jgi:hypothetical protein